MTLTLTLTNDEADMIRYALLEMASRRLDEGAERKFKHYFEEAEAHRKLAGRISKMQANKKKYEQP